MTSPRPLTLGLTLALALACGTSTGPTQQAAFDRALARWQSQQLDSYQFELTRNCFCVLGGQVIVITVEQGTIKTAETTESGTAIAIERELLSYLPTIPDLFDMVQDALNRSVARLLVTYDPSLGYPSRIELDYVNEAIDDESTTIVRNLTALRAAVP